MRPPGPAPPRPRSLLPYLAGKGLGVINASVLCMGLLTHQGPPAWHPAPEPLKRAAAAAAAACAARGVSLPKLALMEAVRDPAIASHLVGFCTRQQVRGSCWCVWGGRGEGRGRRCSAGACSSRTKR